MRTSVSGCGYGDGYGFGRGYGYGFGDGFGDGDGYGYGRGDGDGYSCGRGDGSGYGDGCGNSNSNGFGYGRGNGDGEGYGYGFGIEKNQGITIRTKMEKTEMKYKGIELKEFESEKPVVFDPPKRMLMWNNCDSGPSEANVFAFIPNRRYPVIGIDNSFDHCAEIPEESSEQATVLQLAKWVATGNGLLKRGCCITNYVSFDEIDENSPVSDATLVRKWGDKEWHKPTREYLGLED